MSLSKWFLICLGLFALNLGILYFHWKTGVPFLVPPAYALALDREAFLQIMALQLVIGMPVLFALISLLTAKFLPKEDPYRIRYAKAFLITMTIIYGSFVIADIQMMGKSLPSYLKNAYPSLKGE